MKISRQRRREQRLWWTTPLLGVPFKRFRFCRHIGAFLDERRVGHCSFGDDVLRKVRQL